MVLKLFVIKILLHKNYWGHHRAVLERFCLCVLICTILECNTKKFKKYLLICTSIQIINPLHVNVYNIFQENKKELVRRVEYFYGLQISLMSGFIEGSWILMFAFEFNITHHEASGKLHWTLREWEWINANNILTWFWKHFWSHGPPERVLGAFRSPQIVLLRTAVLKYTYFLLGSFI